MGWFNSVTWCGACVSFSSSVIHVPGVNDIQSTAGSAGQNLTQISRQINAGQVSWTGSRPPFSSQVRTIPSLALCDCAAHWRSSLHKLNYSNGLFLFSGVMRELDPDPCLDVEQWLKKIIQGSVISSYLHKNYLYIHTYIHIAVYIYNKNKQVDRIEKERWTLMLDMWPWTTKPVLSRWGIFVAIAKNTLYGSKL